MCLPNEIGIVVNRAIGRGILRQRAKNRIVEFETRVIVDLEFDAERFRARANDVDGLRVAVIRDEKRFLVTAGADCCNRLAKRHGFGRGRRFVKQRGIGDVERGQVRDHGLEIEQRFEPALRELGLVGRVSSVPTGIFQNVALNDRRRNAIGITGTDKCFLDFVFLRNCSQLGERGRFRFRFGQL